MIFGRLLPTLMLCAFCASAKADDALIAVGASDATHFDTRGYVGNWPGNAKGHGGIVSVDETWSAGEVHVVYGMLSVSNDVTLTIAPGAVVKFVGGGIDVKGALVANGVTFTDVADDDVGGDTCGDGWTQPLPSYSVLGTVEDDATTSYRCLATHGTFPVAGESVSVKFDTRGYLENEIVGVVEHGGIVSADETWAAGEVHVVYGTLSVSNGVTLTIEPGAVVKFVGGGIDAKGTLVAKGVTFTDIADDDVGGDTCGDGWTQPLPSYSIRGTAEDDDATTSCRCLATHGTFPVACESVSEKFDTRGCLENGIIGAREHGGVVASDETWSAGEVHVVYGTLSVQNGVTLTIEPGAVVKFVGGGMKVDGRCTARGVTFTDIDDAARGGSRTGDHLPYTSYVLEGNFETDDETAILCRKGRAENLFDAGRSRVFNVDTDIDRVRFAGEPREITFSTAWDGSSAVEVTETRPDGSTVVLTNGTAECEGVFLWDADETPGLYTLRHATDTNELLASFYRLDDDTEIHEGGQAGTNTWSASSVHVLYGEVVVSAGSILTIEPGSVVKFFPGSVLRVENGGSCVANGVIFTHVNDDEHGGDTLHDGASSIPVDNDYTIEGALEWDAGTQRLHYSNQPIWVAVKNLEVRQRYPWNGLVDVDCEIFCSDPTMSVNLALGARNNATGEMLSVRHVWLESDVTHTNALEVKAGRHRIVWDAGTDAPNVVSDAVSIDVLALVGRRRYLIVDLSEGQDAEKFPVSYLDGEPQGGWTDEYKTEKLVLRLIEPGTFMMGSPDDELGHNCASSYNDETLHRVTLTQPFALGVFELTQRQYELITGSNPAQRDSCPKNPKFPVCCVSYEMLRGSRAGAKWPANDEVDEGSALGILRKKTGLRFDLPTDAQWEYACRAGTTTALNSGKNLTGTTTCKNLNELGRYSGNRNDGMGDGTWYTTVGMYKPNAWGLYDMHGNVSEWCRDWWSRLSGDEVVDPVGALSGSYRVMRGGNFFNNPNWRNGTAGLAINCRSAYRGYCLDWETYPGSGSYYPCNYWGFRVACSSGFCDASASVVCKLDLSDSVRIARESERIAYSPRWGTAEGRVTSCAVSVGGVNLVTSSEEGSVDWVPDTPGVQTLVHTVGEEVLSAQFIVLGDDVLRHTGAIAADETWSAGSVHLVMSDITVPTGVTLTIEPGAIVKFMTGTSLVANGTCKAYGVIFTHVNDDTVGGDTLFDGDETRPVAGAYILSGNVYEDDETEERYGAPVLTSGTIAKNTSWRSRNVYRVTGNLTIASGATLTIMPGAIVKFDSGKMLTVNSGATLNAIGTRAQPIVFTSIKDDEWGGDTNGDGSSSNPAGGDWQYVYVCGMANMEYCIATYGAPSNERGIVETSGGTLNMNACTIAHAKYDGVWNWGGVIRITNSVFVDCGNAVCPYRGSTECDNCVMAFGNYGFMDWSSWNSGTFRNCIFYGMGSGWSDTNSSEEFHSKVTVANCCFFNPGNYTKRSCVKDGIDGNIYADPKFVDPVNGDFRIAEDSPCVDAGDADAAPAKDYYGQPRVGAAADIGICEVLPRHMTSEVDLRASGVSVGTTVAVGEDITVAWTVENLGSAAVHDAWRDKVELVSSRGERILLGEKMMQTGIAVGGRQICRGSWKVPVVAEGEYTVAVTVNYARDVFEGTLTENNVAQSTAIQVEVPVSDISESSVCAIPASGESVLHFDLGAESDNLMITIRAAEGVTAIFGTHGVPTELANVGVVSASGGVISFRVPDGAEDVYVRLVNAGAQDADCSVEFSAAKMQIVNVSPQTVPYDGRVTVRIEGAGLDCVNQLSYRAADGSLVNCDNWRASSSGLIVVTADGAKLKQGAQYRFMLTDADGEVLESEQLVTVTQKPAKPEVWARMEVPQTVRAGRSYVCTIEYGNRGNADAMAPILEVLLSGSGSLSRIGEGVSMKKLFLVGAGGSGDAGILLPGEQRKVQFTYVAGSSADSVSLRIGESAELSAAAARVGARGMEATDYALAKELVADVAAGRGSAVFGRVTDADGEPVCGVALRFEGDDVSVDALTDNLGWYVAMGLDDGEYVVFLNGQTKASPSRIVVEEGHDIRLDVVVPAPNLTVITSDDCDGVYAVAWDSVGEDELMANLVRNGEWVFYGLPIGRYRIVACKGDSFADAQVSIGTEGAPEVLYLIPQRNGKISGRVTGALPSDCFIESGRPVVWIQGEANSYLVETDASGTYILDDVPSGIYAIELLMPDSDRVGQGEVVRVEGSATTTHDIVRPGALEAESSSLKSALKKTMLGSGKPSGVDFNSWLDYGWQVYRENQVDYPASPYNCRHNLSKYWRDRNVREEFSRDLDRFVRIRSDASQLELWGAYAQGAVLAGKQVTKKAKAAVNGMKMVIELSQEVYDLAKSLSGDLASLGEDVESFQNDIAEGATGIKQTLFAIIDLAATGKDLAQLYVQQERLMHHLDQIQRGCRRLRLTKRISHHLELLEKCSKLFAAIDYASDLKEAWEHGEKIADVQERIKTAKEMMAVMGSQVKLAVEWFLRKAEDFNAYHCCVGDVEEDVDTSPVQTIRASSVKSVDPNEMVGPLGAGDPETQRFVKPGEWMTYTVYFENQSNATAAAQEVTVTNPLSEWLDWSTFEMGEVAFNNQIDLGLVGKQNGTSEVTMNGTNYAVRTELKLDEKTGVADWYMRIVDPTTETGWPEDVFAGFLPPNDETFRGEGHLTYRVRVRDDAPANARIDNSATIVFDYNDPIETDPAWWNTVGEVRNLTLALDDKGTTAELSLIACTPFGELPVPSRTGYAFKGWFFGPNGKGGQIKADTIVPSGLTNIYADWEANAVNVWVDGVNNVLHYGDVANFATPASVTNGCTNVVCVGWAGTGDVPAAGTGHRVSFKVTRPSTLRWLYATNYWVSATSGEGGRATLKDAAGVALPANELWAAAGTNLVAEATANEGHAFARWVDAETGAVCGQHGAQPLSVDRPWLVRAEFTNLPHVVQTYLVAFDANGGTGAMAVQSFVRGEAQALGACAFARTGYAFVGWATSANGPVRYADGESVVNLAASGTVTLYAKWQGDAVSFRLPDGTSVSARVGDSISLPTTMPKAGYYLVGWTDGKATYGPGARYVIPAGGFWLEPVYELAMLYGDDGRAVRPGEVAPYKTAATVYDGYLYDAEGVVKGTVQVKVAKGKVDKKTGAFTAKVTATVQLADGSKKVSFKNGIADEYGNVTGLAAKGYELEVSLGVNGLGGTFRRAGESVHCQVDGARNLFSAKDADSKAVAAAIEKMWVGAVNVVGDGLALAVSIARKGKVKVSGTVNGVMVSATSQLLVGEEACCVPVVIAKKARLAFNLWLLDDGTVGVAGLEGVEAGKAGKLAPGAKFDMGDGADRLARALADKGTLYSEYLPDGLAVAQNGSKWVVAPDAKGKAAKAGKVAFNRKTGAVDETKLGANPSALKLTYTSKSGSFKGSFKAYSLEKGKVKSYTVSVTGVMVGDVGYGTATLKKPAVSFSIAIW